jgi:hypothetical protein
VVTWSPSWEVNSFSVNQDLPWILWKCCLLPHSQELSTCSWPKPDQSNPFSPSKFLYIEFNIILPSTPRSSKWHISLRFPHQISLCTSPPPCPANFLMRGTKRTPSLHRNIHWGLEIGAFRFESDLSFVQKCWFNKISYFYQGTIAPVDQDLIVEDSRLHSYTPQPVGLLWTSDQPYAETSTWQQTTFTKDSIHATKGIRTHSPNKRAAEVPRLRPRGHWNRPFNKISFAN